jgi:hypothetical protein
MTHNERAELDALRDAIETNARAIGTNAEAIIVLSNALKVAPLPSDTRGGVDVNTAGAILLGFLIALCVAAVVAVAWC